MTAVEDFPGVSWRLTVTGTNTLPFKNRPYGDGIMQKLEAANVIYDYFTTVELLGELEVVAKQSEMLANQLEKLSELYSQGKIKDSIYRDLREDLCRKSRFVAESRILLSAAVVSRIRQVTTSASRLRHRLESLEIRRSVGAVPDEDYPKIKNELLIKAVEAEDAAMQMIKLKDLMEEAFGRIERYLSEDELPRPASTTRLPEPLPRSQEPQAPNGGPNRKSCPNCGSMNASGAIVCGECGQNLEAPPERLGRPNGEEKIAVAAPTNGQMGVVQSENGQDRAEEKPATERVVYLNTVICPRCGADNLANAMYCFRCKAKLGKMSS